MESEGYNEVKLIGLGKVQHEAYLSNWTNNNSASVCSDDTSNSTWSNWGAGQRDLFVLDRSGNLVLQQNISSGLPNNLIDLVVQLIQQDCDPNLICGEAITCVDDLLYPTTCGPDNCDEPIGDCEECSDGEFDNSNPCNPMECFDGQWIEIVIDCAEQMGIPCEDGVYIDPPEGVCCSSCVLFGDVNVDGALNVIDVVQVVNMILNSQYDLLADIDGDGTINVIDIVQLVSLILN